MTNPEERKVKYEQKRIVHPEDVRNCSGYYVCIECKTNPEHTKQLKDILLLVAPNLGINWPMDSDYRDQLAREGYVFPKKEKMVAPCFCMRSLSYKEFLEQVARSRTECNINNTKNPSLKRKPINFDY